MSIASQRGTRLFSNQSKAGALITAIKTDNKNGTTTASAARTPATTTTKAASVINIGIPVGLEEYFIKIVAP